MTEQTATIALRSYLPADRNFILATWLRGLYYGDSWFSLIPKSIFMSNYHKMLERLLDSPGVEVTVACLKDDEDVIMGYAVSRTVEGSSVLDWVFVKSGWRKLGIAKSLIPKDLKACTHLTKVGKSLKPSSVIFNPFLL